MRGLSRAAVVAFSITFAFSTSAQQTRSQLNAYNNANITTNGRGAITGAILNSMFGALITSDGNQDDANIWGANGSNSFNGQLTFNPSNGAIPISGTAFPVPSLTYSLGSPQNQWLAAYVYAIAMGPYALPGFIIGRQDFDIAITSLSEGTGTGICHEIDMGTPGSDAVGTNNIVQRFNIRSLCAGQGSDIINVFESMTFPFATSFPGGDAFLPGVGAGLGAVQAVVTGSQTGSIFTVTAVTSGTIHPGDWITDTAGHGNHQVGGPGFLLAFNSSCPTATTGTGGVGTYCTQYPQTFSSETITITAHPNLVLSAGGTSGALLENVGFIQHLNPEQVLYDSQLSAGNQQMSLAGSITPGKQLNLGFDVVGNYGWIQSIWQSTAFEPLKLNPSGGPVETVSTVAIGASPTLTTGSCSGSGAVGGSLAGKFTAPLCAAGTIILSGLPTSLNGYTCGAWDQTTPADTLVQTANSVTSVTLKATTAASDAIVFQCTGW